MRHGKLFDRNFALLQSTTNLIFIGAFQPQLNRFFDYRFRVFRCFPWLLALNQTLKPLPGFA